MSPLLVPVFIVEFCGVHRGVLLSKKLYKQQISTACCQTTRCFFVFYQTTVPLPSQQLNGLVLTGLFDSPLWQLGLSVVVFFFFFKQPEMMHLKQPGRTE